MKRFHDSPVSASIFCSSLEVPSVAVTMACVSPRWNNAEPCTRGSRPTSQAIGRIVLVSRPSMRLPSSSTIVRTTWAFRFSNSSSISRRFSAVEGRRLDSAEEFSLSTRDEAIRLIKSQRRDSGKSSQTSTARPAIVSAPPVTLCKIETSICGPQRQTVMCGDMGRGLVAAIKPKPFLNCDRSPGSRGAADRLSVRHCGGKIRTSA